ncbi:MAG TPA: hypothetical protein VFC90_13815 [Planctomycetota bacterium]|nr:hypothetical protein [Planctomycetota bacterium]
MTSPRKGESVSVPCRGCGKAFLKLEVAEGAHALKCAACGRSTTVRVKCKGEACLVMTELAPDRDPGAPGPN